MDVDPLRAEFQACNVETPLWEPVNWSLWAAVGPWQWVIVPRHKRTVYSVEASMRRV